MAARLRMIGMHIARYGLVHLVNGCRGDAEFGGSRTIGSAGASPARAFR